MVFKCKIHEVKETQTPEKDDEFAKDVSEFDTLDALRADIRTKRENERREAVERAFESAAVEKAAANMTCEIPPPWWRSRWTRTWSSSPTSCK